MFLKYGVIFLLFVFLEDSLTYDLKSDIASFFRTNTFSKQTHSTTDFYDRILKIVESAPNSAELNSDRSFQNLTQDELHQFLHPISIFYIAPSKLASLSCHKLVSLLKKSRDDDIGLFTKIIEGAQERKQLTEFLDCLSHNELSPEFLNILAEELFKIPRTCAQAFNFSKKISLLPFYTPPSFLLESEEFNQTSMILYLNFVAPSFIKNSTWNQLHRMNRKILVHIILQNNNLDKKEVLTRVPFVLQDLNLKAIEELNIFDYNKSLIDSVNWNIVQIRKLIDEKDKNNLLDELPNEFLLYMLPRQVQRMNQKVLKKMMNNLKENDNLLFPLAVQLFEYMVPDIPKILHFSDKNNLEIMGKLLYAQNYTYLSKIFGKSLSMEASGKLNSPHYTFFQAYLILGKYQILNERDKLLNLKGLLAAIPTSAIVELLTDHTISEVYLINLLCAPKGNKVRAAAILELYKKLGYKNYTELALQNEQNDFISLISPLEILTNASSILQFLQKDESENLKRRTANLPTYILTELLRKDGDITFEDVFNVSHPIYLAILGLNCEILSKIPITDFMPIFEYYNRQRKLYNKEFPKDLQKCAQMSFLSYLHDKALVQEGDHNNIIHFLDLVDIRSVGGYVLATLPVEQILISQHYNEIIREIGSLSLPELMLAVPEDHLRTLVFKYLEKTNTGTISLKYLLILGNLTHYLREEALKIIEPSALKLMLEANVLDTRICANASTRKIWAELLLSTFGPLKTWEEDTVLAVADMLTTFEKRQLDNIDGFVRLNVADLFESNYVEEIPWRSERLPFYEVCLSTLPYNERTSYELSITNLTWFYAVSIENQLESILPPNKNSNSIKISNSDEETNSEKSAATLPSRPSKEKNSEDFDSRISTQSFMNGLENFVSGLSLFKMNEKMISSTVLVDTTNIPQFTTQVYTFATEPSSKTAENILENGNIEHSTMVDNNFTTFNAQSTKFSGEVSQDFGNAVTRSISNSDVLTNSRATADSETSTITLASNDVTTKLKVATDSEMSTTITLSSSDVAKKLEATTDSKTSSTTLPSNNIITELRVTTALETSPTIPPSNDVNTKLEDTSNVETSPTTLSSALPSSSWHSDLFTTTIDEGFTEKIKMLSTEIAADITTNSNSEIEKENSKSTTVTNSNENKYNLKTTQAIDSQLTSTSASPSSLSSIAQTSTIRNVEADTNGISLTTKTINLNTLSKTTVKSRDQREIKTINNGLLSVEINEEEIWKNFTDSFKNIHARHKRESDLFNSEINLSCNTLKVLGPLSKFLIPLLNFTNEEYFNCIELIGQMKLSSVVKKQIWSSVKDKIPASNLGFIAGNLLTEISAEDISVFNFNVEVEWGLEIVNFLTNNQHISKELNEKFRIDNENKMNSLPIFSIIALRQTVCQFSVDTLKELVQSDTKFFNIWSLFYTLDNCPKDCLRTMAKVAIKFFGKPSNWTSTVFAQLGPVVAGLPDEYWESNFIYHLHTSAIRCLSEDKIKKLNHAVDVRKMSLNAVEMLYKEHRNLLPPHPQISNSSTVEIVMENDYFIKKKKPMVESNKPEVMKSLGKFLKPDSILLWFLIFRYFA